MAQARAWKGIRGQLPPKHSASLSFFFNATALTEIYTLSLHDALPISLLVMRSNLWASGYDVDGTDQTSLGQFSGRVQQTYKHSVPRFFVPEHGTMFTLALDK